MKKIFLSSLLSIVFLCPVFAVTQQDSSVVTLSISALCRLDITNADQTINLSGMELENAYTNGYVDAAVGTPTLIVWSNAPWELKAQVMVDWSWVNSYHKTTSDLQLKVTSTSGNQTGFTSFTSLSTTNQTIATSSSGAGAQNYACQYRILLDRLVDVPGTYSITLRYTLATTA